MLKKPLLIVPLVGLAGLTIVLNVLLSPTRQESSPSNSASPTQRTASEQSPPTTPDSAKDQPENTQPPEQPKTTMQQKKLDYASWQSALKLTQGPVLETLAKLDANPSPQSDYMAASLLHMCYLRQQNPPMDSALEGYPPRDECLELGTLSQVSWVERMKSAADAGLAAAQVAMAFAENPNPLLSPSAPNPWLEMQRDYIDRATAQCHPGAYIIRANYRFDPDNPQLQNQEAYTDFYTAELIYRHRFEGAPSLEKLLEQERIKLHQHQILEAETQALINYHKTCTR